MASRNTSLLPELVISCVTGIILVIVFTMAWMSSVNSGHAPVSAGIISPTTNVRKYEKPTEAPADDLS